MYQLIKILVLFAIILIGKPAYPFPSLFSPKVTLEEQFKSGMYSEFMIYLLQMNLFMTGFYEGEISGKWNNDSDVALKNMTKENYSSDIVLNKHFVSFQLENMAILEDLEFFFLEDDELETFIYIPNNLIEEFKKTKDGFKILFTKETDIDIKNPSLTYISSINFNHDFFHALTLNDYGVENTESIKSVRKDDIYITSFRSKENTNVSVKTLYYGAKSETFILESNTNENILFTLLDKSIIKNEFDSIQYDEIFLNLVDQYKNLSSNKINKDDLIISNGTGVLINHFGQVLTNNHVVKQCKEIKIDEVLYRIIASDKKLDLSVIEPSSNSNIITNYAHISATPPILNENITVSGFPLSGILDGLVVTQGNVSSELGLRGYDEHFTITAPIQSGNSGSPVINENGEIIGLVVAKMNDFTSMENLREIPQNVNFAIKNEHILHFFKKNNIKHYKGNPERKVNKEIAQIAKNITKRVDCISY